MECPEPSIERSVTFRAQGQVYRCVFGMPWCEWNIFWLIKNDSSRGEFETSLSVLLPFKINQFYAEITFGLGISYFLNLLSHWNDQLAIKTNRKDAAKMSKNVSFPRRQSEKFRRLPKGANVCVCKIEVKRGLKKLCFHI